MYVYNFSNLFACMYNCKLWAILRWISCRCQVLEDNIGLCVANFTWWEKKRTLHAVMHSGSQRKDREKPRKTSIYFMLSPCLESSAGSLFLIWNCLVALNKVIKEPSTLVLPLIGDSRVDLTSIDWLLKDCCTCFHYYSRHSTVQWEAEPIFAPHQAGHNGGSLRIDWGIHWLRTVSKVKMKLGKGRNAAGRVLVSEVKVMIWHILCHWQSFRVRLIKPLIKIRAGVRTDWKQESSGHDYLSKLLISQRTCRRVFDGTMDI
jgi:hypothetical protein